MRFWDSSAVIPLLVEHEASSRTVAWMATDHAIVLWTLTPVEVASAVRRLVREGVLDEDLAHGAEGRMDDIVGASQAEGHSQGRHFYTLDRRLAVAAQREGFIVPS